MASSNRSYDDKSIVAQLGVLKGFELGDGRIRHITVNYEKDLQGEPAATVTAHITFDLTTQEANVLLNESGIEPESPPHP
jgi:hypothetical protein